MKTAKPTYLAAVVTLAFSLALTGCAGGNTESQTADAASSQPTQAGSVSSESAEESAPAGPSAQADQSEQDGQSGQSPLSADADLSRVQPQVTPEDAITAAQADVGDGTVHAIELDHDRRDDAWQYEVKILSGTTDYDVTVDADSGDVVGRDEDTTEDSEQAIDLSSPMTFDEALGLAAGQGTGRLTSWKLESDDDRIEYQFDYEDGSADTEVTVDVDSKTVTVDN
ncbi:MULTISPECIES: PepSY domain-containing protein [Brevibacterium]|uniref:PepSY domain-containing protein n=1 Tax=Brevibacterium casei TaxID=33889 RepID=A0A7T3ZX48_9MICO|nr:MULTISPECIES: PepSY domain-containing protein [Brevibacterium]QQB13259.1 PepSY domain-containing protein [Brevibacterium casei]